MQKYFRGRWPEEVVPEDEPLWLHYEVDVEADHVLRTVEIFADGRHIRNSLALEARDGFACVSIVHGPFMQYVPGSGLEEVDAEMFEQLWRISADTPYP